MPAKTRTQLLEYGCIALGVAAAVLLAVGGQAAWLLRLGIVLALAATLAAAALAVSARRAARAGHEPGHPDGGELDELRDELAALRRTLQTLVGGQLVVERVALQARATRLRSLPDGQFVDADLASIAAHQAIPSQDRGPGQPAQRSDRGTEAASGDAVGRRRTAVGQRSGNGRRPVDELLAANGASSTPRHHRRRGGTTGGA